MLWLKTNISLYSFIPIHASFVNSGASCCSESFYQGLCFVDTKKHAPQWHIAVLMVQLVDMSLVKIVLQLSSEDSGFNVKRCLTKLLGESFLFWVFLFKFLLPCLNQVGNLSRKKACSFSHIRRNLHYFASPCFHHNFLWRARN